LLVDGTGRDHPRGAGLAVHLGAVLDLATVGVTHRPLMAAGDWPEDRRGATSPLLLDGAPVGMWLRTRAGARPLAVHPGWRTDLETSARIVEGAAAAHRTPEALRHARMLARTLRAGRPIFPVSEP
jgi:deoxyribonuclease V